MRCELEYQPLTAEELAEKSRERARRNGQVKERVAECRAALDLALLGHGGKGPLAGLLHGALAAACVGIFGHSFGGATALQAAFADERFRVCVALDAWMLPLDADLVENGLSIPTLFQQGDHFQRWEENSSVKRKLVSVCSDESALFALKRTRHQNFTDVPWLSVPLLRYTRSIGRIDPEVAMRIITSTTIEFFASHFAHDDRVKPPAYETTHIDWEKRPNERSLL